MKVFDTISTIKEKPENEECSQKSGPYSKFNAKSQVLEDRDINLKYKSMDLKGNDYFQNKLLLGNGKLTNAYKSKAKPTEKLKFNHGRSNSYEYVNLDKNVLSEEFREIGLNYDDLKRSFEKTDRIVIGNSNIRNEKLGNYNSPIIENKFLDANFDEKNSIKSLTNSEKIR